MYLSFNDFGVLRPLLSLLNSMSLRYKASSDSPMVKSGQSAIQEKTDWQRRIDGGGLR